MSKMLSIQEKLQRSKHNVFYHRTAAPNINEDNIISFKDLFCLEQEKLVKCILFTYNLDQVWFLNELNQIEKEKNFNKYSSYKDIDIEVIYGRLDKGTNLPKNIRSQLVELKTENGYTPVQHAKLFIFQYAKSIRLVISSANLCQDHWYKNHECTWISPKCEFEENESNCYFKNDLITFLRAYENFNINLTNWIECVSKINFQNIKVYLVASVPGIGSTMNSCISHTLSAEILLAARDIINYPYVYYNVLLKNEGTLKFTTEQIMVTLNTCSDTFQGWTVEDISDLHMKTYYRTAARHRYDIDAPKNKMDWFLLTSANLTAAGWGYWAFNKFKVNNFELGVLFLKENFKAEFFNTIDFPVLLPTPPHPTVEAE